MFIAAKNACLILSRYLCILMIQLVVVCALPESMLAQTPLPVAGDEFLPFTESTAGAAQICNNGPILRAHYTGGRGISHLEGFTSFGMFAPWSLDMGLAFLDGQLVFNERSSLIPEAGSRVGARFGGGLRQLTDSGVRGAGFWYEFDDRFGDMYQQFGVSLEWMSDDVDFRANGYLPFGDTSRVAVYEDNDPIFTGNDLVVQQITTITEAAYSGADMELGRHWPGAFGMDDISVFGGGYVFAADNSPTISGVSLRVQTNITPGIAIHLGATHDTFIGSQGTIGLSGYLPRFRWPRGNDCRRLMAPVRRLQNLVIQASEAIEIIPATSPDTGSPVVFVHVDSNATTPGDGTFEMPFMTLQEAENGSAENDIIYAHADSNFAMESIALKDGQRFLGEGMFMNEELQHTLVTNEVGAVTIPRATDGVEAPIISESPGNSIDLATNSEVSGFTINDATGAAVSANSINMMATVDKVAINGGATGISIQDSDGPFTFTDTTVTDPDGVALGIDGGSPVVDYSSGSLTKTTAGNIVDIQNVQDATINVNADIAASGAASGINIANNTGSNTIGFTGDLQLGTSADRLTGGPGVSISGNASRDTTISFGALSIFTDGQDGFIHSDTSSVVANTGTTTVNVLDATAMNLIGSTGDLSFGELDVDFTGANTGIDFTDSTLLFSAGNTNIQGDGEIGSIAIDLSGTGNDNGPNSGTPNILLAALSGQTADISEVETGVLMGTTGKSAGANFIYGDQLLSDTASTISVIDGGTTLDTTNLISTNGTTQGRYEFLDVTFTGEATFQKTQQPLLFVGSVAAGAMDGSDVDNRMDGTILQATSTAALANTKIVLVNDADQPMGQAQIDLGGTLNLGLNTDIAGFGNGATVQLLDIPVNVIVDFATEVSDPFGNGAATLTASGADVVNLNGAGSDHQFTNFNIVGGNTLVTGDGFNDLSITGVQMSDVGAGGSVFSFANPTGTIDVTDANNSIDTTESLLTLDGGNAVVNISQGLALNSGGFTVANTTGGALTITNATITETDGDTINISDAAGNVTINSDIAINNAIGSAVSIINMDGNAVFNGTTTIKNSSNLGVEVDGGTGNITFNQLNVDGAIVGLRVKDLTGSLAVTGDGTADSGGTIQNTSLNGVEIDNASNVTLDWMGIETTGVSGVVISSSSDNIALNNMRIMDNTANGVTISESTGVTLTNVSINDADDFGIEIQSSQMIAVNNSRIETIGLDGIRMFDSNTVNVSFTEVVDTGNVGIRVLSSGAITIDESKVTDTFSDGIRIVESSGVAVQNSELTNWGTGPFNPFNVRSGILVTAPTTGNFNVIGNDFTNTAGIGHAIALVNSGVVTSLNVSGNTMSLDPVGAALVISNNPGVTVLSGVNNTLTSGTPCVILSPTLGFTLINGVPCPLPPP